MGVGTVNQEGSLTYVALDKEVLRLVPDRLVGAWEQRGARGRL